MHRLWTLPRLSALLLIAAPLSAQTDTTAAAKATCPDTLAIPAGRVCAAALDGLAMLHPLAALLISGGNPVLGTAGAGADGRFGHFRLGVRVTRTAAVMPDLTYEGSEDTVKVKRRLRLYAQHLDLSTGVFRKTMGKGNIAMDFLLSALLLPKDGSEDFHPVPGSRTLGSYNVALDWGIRAAMNSPTMPLISLSIVKRGMPTGTIGSITTTDLAAYTFNATALNVRLFVGKNSKRLEFAAGAGVDLLGGNGVAYYRDPITLELQEPIETTLSGMRLITAANLGVIVGPVRFIGEGGYQAASKLLLTTKFAENDTNAGRFYASLGVSIVR